jgi:hypothetical protein
VRECLASPVGDTQPTPELESTDPEVQEELVRRHEMHAAEAAVVEGYRAH